MTHAPPKPIRGKKLFVAVIILLAGAILGHAVWAAVEKRGVSRRVAAIRAAGEPILPADFATTNPAAPDNGGADILAAGDAVEAYARSNKDYGLLDAALPLRPEERKVIGTALTDLAAPLANLERASRQPRHEWDLDFTQSPVLINLMLPKMAGPRALAILLRDAALLDHANGDDAAAFRRLDQGLTLVRFADRHPSLVGHLVAIGCTAIVTDAIFQIAPDLKIGATAGSASPDVIREMIATLLDDELPRQGLSRALRGERMAQLDAVQLIMSGTMTQTTPGGNKLRDNAMARYVFAPFFHRNSVLMLDRMTALSQLAGERDLPTVTAKLPPPHARGSPMNMLADILLPSIERVFQTHHRLTSDRRLAATVLAIRLYQLDHAGQRPAKLADLVPKYLPAVPDDALIGKPLGYLPHDARPRVYSAGENHVDDGGSDALIKPYSDRKIGERGEEWGTLDRCVFLDLQPRPAPPPPLDPAEGDEGEQPTGDVSATGPVR